MGDADMSETITLEVTNLTKKYGDTLALHDLDITFTEGIYGILGPNGAGKTTLINLLTDNIGRTSGEICLCGQPILKLGEKYRCKIGYMPQQQGLYDHMSALSFLMYIASLKGIPRAAAKEEALSLLKSVHLENVATGG